MRVTHVITRLIIGGAQENTIATVLGLGKIPGMEVRLLAGPASGPEGSLEPGLASTPGLLTLVPSLVRPIDPWHDVVCWARLVKVFRATRQSLSAAPQTPPCNKTSENSPALRASARWGCT